MNRSIELVRYRDFHGDLLALELVAGTRVDQVSPDGAPATPTPHGSTPGGASKTVTEYLDHPPKELRDLYHAVEDYCIAMGDDVTKKTLKNYFACRRLKNFACVEVHPQTRNRLFTIQGVGGV